MKEFVSFWKAKVEKERKAQMKSLEIEIQMLSLRERVAKGRAIIGELYMKKRELDTLVLFFRKFGQQQEIRVGDVVLVTPKGKNPLKVGVQGVVREISQTRCVVDVAVFPFREKTFRIDLYSDETTFNRMKQALDEINPRIVALLKGKKPKLGIRKVAISEKLNEFQRKAVKKALGSELFLIHGPFGTGKTTTLAEIINLLVKKGKKVLVTADSNTAVDNLVERLSAKVVRIGHPARIHPKVLATRLEERMRYHPKYPLLEAIAREIARLREERSHYLRPYSSLRRGLTDEQILSLARWNKTVRGLKKGTIKSMASWIAVTKELSKLSQQFENLKTSVAKDVIREAEVVATTNAGSYSDVLSSFSFDVAVIDEATQSTLPSTIMPMNKAKQWILAGDHKQLPPTVISADSELKVSLFERLIKLFPSHSEMLRIQYRMHERLMFFPSCVFYDNKLIAAETTKRLNGEIKFMNVPGVEKCWPSKMNPEEVKVVKQIVSSLLKKWLPENIGVITPYKEQRDQLRKILNVEVNTVDGFQGREKDVIILSLVRANPAGKIGFLSDPRRLNVAITRARQCLIIVGNEKTLSRNKLYKALILYAKGKLKTCKEIRAVLNERHVSSNL